MRPEVCWFRLAALSKMKRNFGMGELKVSPISLPQLKCLSVKFCTPAKRRNDLEQKWYSRVLLFLYCKASLYISVGAAITSHWGIMLKRLLFRTMTSASALWTSDHFQELWGSYASSYSQTHFILSQQPLLKQQSRPLSTGRCISMKPVSQMGENDTKVLFLPRHKTDWHKRE